MQKNTESLVFYFRLEQKEAKEKWGELWKLKTVVVEVHFTFKLIRRLRKMALELVSCVKMFDGFQKVFKHTSSETKTEMTFGVFMPSQAEEGGGYAWKDSL